MKLQTEIVHHGLIRTNSNKANINIEERISLARRTLYSLIKSGVHGTNGLNPRTSYNIDQVYIIPRLLYGLATVHLLKKDLELLTNFHLNTIKRLQALPNRTATATVYLLFGATPIIAETHKRQLSLLFSIATCTNTSIRNVAWKQAALGSEHIFFTKIVNILHIYKLPEFRTIMNG